MVKNKSSAKAAVSTRDNQLAVVSFGLGIASFCGFGALAGIPAIVTGHISLKQPSNKGFGIAGLVMGYISTVLSLIVVIMLFFFLLLVAFLSSVPEVEYSQGDEPIESPNSSYRSI